MALHFHVVTVLLTFFLSCAASFPVFVVCTVSTASEPSLMNVHKQGHTGEGDTASQLAVGLAGLSVPEARERQTQR